MFDAAQGLPPGAFRPSVLRPRAAIGGRIFRRRECRHGGQRMTTQEQAGE